MKRLTTLAALAMAIATYAQDADTLGYTMCVASYDYTCHSIDVDSKPKDVTYRIAVQVGKKVACSMGYAEHADTLRREKLTEAKHHIPRTYHNWPEGKTTAHEVMPFERFVTTDAANSIKWKLTNETDSVMKLTCQKAVGEYGGRRWTVWFAPDIPSAAGPWRLGGLPGLILKAEADGVHRFECFDIDFVKEPIVVPHSSGTKVKHSQFVKFRNKKLYNNKYQTDQNYQIAPSEVEHVMVMFGTPMVNGIMMKDATVKFIPLELK